MFYPRSPFWLTLIFWCNPVWAAEESTTTTLAQSPLNSTTLLTTVVGLMLVLSIIGGLAWLIKRTGRFSNSANGAIKVLAAMPLGPRERAVLLEVGDEQILVGVTSQHIQTLHVLDKKVAPTKNNEKHSFKQQLQNILTKEQP